MTTARPSVLFVGESPPAAAPSDFIPFDCASGTNLSKVLGFTSRSVLLEHVPRANIFDTPGVGIAPGSKWDDAAASKRGEALIAGTDATVIVALGRKTAAALGVDGIPPWGTWHRWQRIKGGDRWHHNGDYVDVLVAPHPSQQSTSLKTPTARSDARRFLLPELVAGCPTLRPWHFDLDHGETIYDLGAALSPMDVALGVATLRVCQEIHRAQSIPRWTHGVTLDSYRRTVDVSLRSLAIACQDGHSAVAQVIGGVMWSVKIGSEIRTRASAAAKDERVKGYPVAVLRATLGRYAALGVL